MQRRRAVRLGRIEVDLLLHQRRHGLGVLPHYRPQEAQIAALGLQFTANRGHEDDTADS